MRFSEAQPRLASLVILSVLWTTAASWTAAQPVTVLEGATVIDGLSDRAMRNVNIVVAGDTIQSIGPGGSSYPARAEVLDLSGKFIIPGLLESHVHWEEWQGELYVNHGVTSVVALTNLDQKTRASNAKSLSIPRTFHAGARPRFSAKASREEAREAVQRWLKSEPDMVKFPDFNAENAQVYRWAAEEVHKAGYVIFGHAEDAPAAIDAGLDVVEHVWGFTQAQMTADELKRFQEGEFITWGTFTKDWTRLDKMIREAVRKGAALNPTLLYEWGGMSEQAVRHEYEDYRLLSNPGLGYFPDTLAEELLTKHRLIKNFSIRYDVMPVVSQLDASDRQQFQDAYQKVLEFVRRFVQAGGKIHSGTDAPSGGIPGLSLHHEMEMLVEAGLTPMQAILSTTSWPSEMLGGKNGVRPDPKVGSLKAGNYADLVVLGADPLADIRNTQKIERVMKGGKFVTLEYHPDFYTFTKPARRIAGSSPFAEISSITPSSVVEGSPDLELVVEGVGFTGQSVVRINAIGVPTIFEGPRRLRATVPAKVVSSAAPNRFRAPGPAQNVGIYGDLTVSIAVFNPTAHGGLSNSVSLVVIPKWRDGK